MGKTNIIAINARAMAVSDPVQEYLDLKESKLKDVIRKLRKTTTIYRALNPKSNNDRLYINRKKRGRSLMSVEHYIIKE